METTSSVSKGIFAFPVKKQKKKLKIDLKHATWMTAKPWYAVYQKTWKNLEDHMEHLYEQVFSDLLIGVSSYIREEVTDMSQFVEIPTATILTGVNLPDHSVLFTSLEERLKDISPHIVTLYSRSCPKVRTMTGRVLNQCQQISQAEESLEDENDPSEPDEVKSRIAPCTYSDLAKWYTNQYGNDGKKVPIVVVLADFEGFPPQVLEDFIYIASEHQHEVPLVLVLGVATTESAVHTILPHRVISKLRIHTFTTQNSHKLLNELIERVILSPDCQFRIGGSIFKQLSDNFLFYDFSVQSFLQKFKFCMLTHFSVCGIPLGTGTDEDMNIWIQNLNNRDLNKVRKLPSFREYLEQQPAAKKVDLLTKSDVLKTEIFNIFRNFISKFKVFLIGLKCLQKLTHDLPDSPLGKHLGSLYFRAVNIPICQCEEFKRCEEILRNLAKDNLDLHLKNIIHILKECDVEDTNVNFWLSNLKKYKQKLHSLEREALECSSPSKKECTLDMKPKDHREFKKQLLERVHMPKELNRFEKLRSEILSDLSQMLGGGEKSLTQPPLRLPLHEILIFSGSEAVKEQILTTSRLTLHTGLTNPHSYLQCDCCKIKDKGDVLPSMPDTSIVYKLYLECGKHINLYDWLQSFKQVISPPTEQDEEDDEAVDVQTQSRFTQAVSELQFMGFVKPSSRKTDHVVRLTYGYS